MQQYGHGIGEQAYDFFNKNKDDVLQQIMENPDRVFQGISNAQRFVSKEFKGDTRPIRYLERGEFHLPNHNFTGPGTKISKPYVRDFAPYNAIDACSKTHDIRYAKAFRARGEKRRSIIRDADKKVLECYSNHPNEDGYRLAKTGINSKMLLEDVSPETFDKVVGEAYRGAEVQQKGGLAPFLAAAYGIGIPATALLYGEYKLGRYMYDRYARSSN